MRNVLRLKAGDMIFVRLPDGKLQPMTVCQIDEKGKKIILQVCDVSDMQEGENQPTETSSIESREFTLFMALPKSSKFDLIVRQATECGVARIIPIKTEFSQNGSEKINFRSERFDRIIKEARQQSGSPVDTKITDCKEFSEACKIWQNETENLSESEKIAIVLYERNDSTVSIRQACQRFFDQGKLNTCNLKKIALFCGSEGGISPSEIELLQKTGFIPVHLKTNILRCETAALYGISALQSSLSD